MPTPQAARRRAIRSVLAPLLLGLALAAAVMVVNEVSQYQARQASEEVVQAVKSREQLDSLLRLMLNAETGQRGYLLTGNESYLEPYASTVAKIGPAVDSLRAIYNRNGKVAPAAFTSLVRNIQRKIAEMDISIRLRREGNTTAWRGVMQSDLGKDFMDVIRSDANALIEEMQSAYGTADARMRTAMNISRLSVLMLTVMAMVAFVIYLLRSYHFNRQEMALQAALQNERDHLDQQVQRRTATLRELATHLQTVQESERSLLARELHDELGSMLTAAKLDMARLGKVVAAAGSDAQSRLQHLSNIIDQVIALKRRIIEDLRPSALQHLGLVNALEHMAKEFATRSGIEVTHDLQAVELDADAQLTLYRVVQEAFTNIAKYAKATQVHLHLKPLPPDGDNASPSVEVLVRDNGKGFDTNRIHIKKHGLMGMRHRLEAAQGSLNLQSAHGRGTTITARLPVLPPAAAQNTTDDAPVTLIAP